MRQAILIIPFLMVLLSCNLSKDPDEDLHNISVTISNPADQSVVDDSVLIECEISHSEMITKIELWVNNDSTGIYDLTYPFSIIWDTRDHENGTYDVFIRSYDQVGTKFDSETITINISNFLVYSKTYGSSQVNDQELPSLHQDWFPPKQNDQTFLMMDFDLLRLSAHSQPESLSWQVASIINQRRVVSVTAMFCLDS